MTKEENIKKIIENNIEQKLLKLKGFLLIDNCFKDFKITDELYFLSAQDPTIWVEGFHESIKVQVKVQLSGKNP